MQPCSDSVSYQYGVFLLLFLDGYICNLVTIAAYTPNETHGHHPNTTRFPKKKKKELISIYTLNIISEINKMSRGVVAHLIKLATPFLHN